MMSTPNIIRQEVDVPRPSSSADAATSSSSSYSSVTKTTATKDQPLRRPIDPIVRAMNTIMYGLVVHYGTRWTIELSSPHAVNSSSSLLATPCPTDNDEGIFAFYDQSCSNHPSPSILPTVLLLHEYWVYLQHANVVGNPLLQHLDRRYGIALLKTNNHWSIAGTLSSYWARETLSMFLCLPFLTPTTTTNTITTTQYLILYSIVYHTIKSRGVRYDAVHRSSCTFGIMKLVIDNFYNHTWYEIFISLLRLGLQSVDTYIHYCIVRDLLYVSYSSTTTATTNTNNNSMMDMLFACWVVHAAANQYFHCSTATIVVHVWNALTAISSSKNEESKNNNIQNGGRRIEGELLHRLQIDVSDDTNEILNLRSIDNTNESTTSNIIINRNAPNVDGDYVVLSSIYKGSSSSSSSGNAKDDTENNAIVANSTNINDDDDYIDDDDNVFIVRKLLRHNQSTHTNLRGRHAVSRVASKGVDKAVRLETSIMIIAVYFMIGLGIIPLRALSMTPTLYFSWHESILSLIQDRERMLKAALPAWLLWSMLHGVWVTFLKSSSRHSQSQTLGVYRYSTLSRRRSFVHLFDLIVVIQIGIRTLSPNRRSLVLFAAIILTGKGFVRRIVILQVLSVVEFVTKLAIMRQMLTTSSTDMIMITTILSIVWIAWVVIHPTPTPCEIDKTYQLPNKDNNARSDVVVDAVFLGHPALLSDAWALWLLPYQLKERWQAPLWTWPLWPIHYIVGWYCVNYRRGIFGDDAAFFCADDHCYGHTRLQNWVACHFGRHFVTHPRQVKDNIIACARHAEKVGVKVLCLGSLNKAESINGGGVGVVQALGPNRRLSVIHGNHLTAATVVQTIYQCFGELKVRLFLTGASSKVGWAVAQALRDRYGYDVLCHSTDPGRRIHFEKHGFASASRLAEGTEFSDYWIVGKYDMEVAKWIPQNSVAIVFSVPHSLESRPDLRVIEAGTLHMDLAHLDKSRVFTNKLKEYEIFACHAASVVAASRLKAGKVLRIDEVGPVDVNHMDSWLEDAIKLGFTTPQYKSVQEMDRRNFNGNKPPVVIIGGGPSGLSVAACLSQKLIPHILLEAENDANVFGSWTRHFDGLEITTQKKWCNLPGFAMCDKEFPNETVTANDYQRYLKEYACRYAINICRGAKVISVEKGTVEYPYIVKYTRSGSMKLLMAWSVVDASGKHRIPQINTSDDIVSKLDSAGIHHVHSTDMSSESTWARAIQAAQSGRLCVVGFGNSAADLITMLLQRCNECNCNRDSQIMTRIHVAARSVPPVFPRRFNFFRVDTIGYFLRILPEFIQEMLLQLLWDAIPDSKVCQLAFPSYLKRWTKINGRVPVIDKHGMLAQGFKSGNLVGHGPISKTTKGQIVHFSDGLSRHNVAGVEIDMVILATGYRDGSLVEREDRLNGLYKCGFGKSDLFLPLLTIGDDANWIANDIAAFYCVFLC